VRTASTTSKTQCGHGVGFYQAFAVTLSERYCVCFCAYGGIMAFGGAALRLESSKELFPPFRATVAHMAGVV
jgi:hypothetical protein